MAIKTVTTEIHLSDISPYLIQFDRTLIKNDLKYWIGKEHSPMGIQGLLYSYKPEAGFERYARDTGGKVVSGEFVRKDIFCAQFKNLCACYVDLTSDGFYVAVYFDNGIISTHEEKEEIRQKVLSIISDAKYSEFIARQKRWFSEEPWKKVAGMTPQEAYDYLESEGW